METPHTSVAIRRIGDGFHSILFNGVEIAQAVKHGSVSAVYPTPTFGKTEVTLTLVVDDFHADDSPTEKGPRVCDMEWTVAP